MVLSLKIGAATVRVAIPRKVRRAVRERTEAIEGSRELAVLYEWELDRHMLVVEWEGGERIIVIGPAHRTVRPLARQLAFLRQQYSDGALRRCRRSDVPCVKMRISMDDYAPCSWLHGPRAKKPPTTTFAC